ncbi:hypothetical protein ACQJBY_015488 [Aegilops geniculata]
MGALVHVGVDPTVAGAVASCRADLAAWPMCVGEVHRGRGRACAGRRCLARADPGLLGALVHEGASRARLLARCWREKLLKRRGGAAGGSRDGAAVAPWVASDEDLLPGDHAVMRGVLLLQRAVSGECDGVWCTEAGAAAPDLFFGDDGRGGHVGSATVGARGHRYSPAVRRPSVVSGTLGTGRWVGSCCCVGCQICPNVAVSGSCCGC